MVKEKVLVPLAEMRRRSQEHEAVVQSAVDSLSATIGVG